MNLILSLLVVLVTAAPGRHVGFPSQAVFLNQYVYVYRDGTGHFTGGGKTILANYNTRKIVKTWTGTWDSGPGKLTVTRNGKLIVPVVDVWFDNSTNPSQLRERVHLWCTRDLKGWYEMPAPNLGNVTNSNGHMIELADSSLVWPVYDLNGSYLYRYANGVWTKYATFDQPPGVEYNEADIEILPTGEWIVGIRAATRGNPADYWIAIGRSKDLGKTWNIQRSTVRGQAADLCWYGSRLYMGVRGYGGSAVLSSSDGISWSKSLLLEPATTGDCAYVNLMVYRGSLRAIWYSDKGSAIKMTDLALNKVFLPMVGK